VTPVTPVTPSNPRTRLGLLGWAQFAGGAAAVLATALPWATGESKSLDGFDHGAWAVLVLVLGVCVAALGVITITKAASRLPAALPTAVSLVLAAAAAVAVVDWRSWIADQNDAAARLSGGLDQLGSQLGGLGGLANLFGLAGAEPSKLSMGYGLWVLVGAAGVAFVAALIQSVRGHR
jgi:hypothetical protein